MHLEQNKESIEILLCKRKPCKRHKIKREYFSWVKLITEQYEIKILRILLSLSSIFFPKWREVKCNEKNYVNFFLNFSPFRAVLRSSKKSMSIRNCRNNRARLINTASLRFCLSVQILVHVMRHRSSHSIFLPFLQIQSAKFSASSPPKIDNNHLWLFSKKTKDNDIARHCKRHQTVQTYRLSITHAQLP